MRFDRCPGPVSRRSFLQAGAVGVGGLGLNHLMAMQARAAANAPNDTSCIFVWLPGRAATHGDVRYEAGGSGRVSRRVLSNSNQRAMNRCLRIAADAREGCRQVFDHPVCASHVCRSWRRTQTVHDRSRSERTNRVRQRLSGVWIDDLDDARA